MSTPNISQGTPVVGSITEFDYTQDRRYQGMLGQPALTQFVVPSRVVSQKDWEALMTRCAALEARVAALEAK